MDGLLHDDLGRGLALTNPPQRLVSLVPSVTELICDLGAGGRLVGVTRYCSEPAGALAHLPRLGGTKTPLRERIVALRPDLVVVNSEENRREDFEALAAAGIPLFVSFVRRVADCAAAVERLGAAIDARPAAARLAAALRAAEAASRSAASTRMRVFCPIWRRPWMSFNADTYCHDLLAAAGGENVCAGAAQRYPTVTLDAIAAAQPEVILLPDEPYPFSARHRADLAALADTPAGRTDRIHLVDGKALSWYGTRTIAALHTFGGLLGPASG